MKPSLRFLPLFAALLSAGMVHAQQRGPALPSLDQLKATLNLTELQSAQISPLLDELAAAQKTLLDLQTKSGALRAGLAENVGAILTDAQKTQLSQLLNPVGARGGRGAPPVLADQPSPRADTNSQLAHTQLLAKARQGHIDVYLEGDSIVRRWGATDYPDYLANWKQNFFGWNAADFGWGADTIQNILWRLDNGELDGVNPKVIVLLAGTNNVGTQPGDDAKAAEISRGLKAVLDRFQRKAPGATVILTGIFPRNNSAPLLAFINKINDSLARLADGKKVRYLNINDKLADADGQIFPGMLNTDNLHPALKGYQVWADGLKPILTELLGPPAKEDLAPPPTGDPSAKPATPVSPPVTGAPAGR